MIDLHEIGRQNGYRCKWDESRIGREKDPYLMILPGSYGHIYLHGPDEVAFATTVQRARALRGEIDGVVFRQVGDDGINATFPLVALPQVARKLSLYKKRTGPILSDEQRQANVDRLAKWRFVKKVPANASV